MAPNRLCFLSMKLWVHTAILSIKTVCSAREFQVPEKSYNIHDIRPWTYIRDFFPCIRPWSYTQVILCSGNTGINLMPVLNSFTFTPVHCFQSALYNTSIAVNITACLVLYMQQLWYAKLSLSQYLAQSHMVLYTAPAFSIAYL